jgi:hypothetical protein
MKNNEINCVDFKRNTDISNFQDLDAVLNIILSQSIMPCNLLVNEGDCVEIESLFIKAQVLLNGAVLAEME